MGIILKNSHQPLHNQRGCAPERAFGLLLLAGLLYALQASPAETSRSPVVAPDQRMPGLGKPIWAGLWHYTASFDGRKHWLNLTAESAEVQTPEGLATMADWPGEQPPTLFTVCEEGEPLNITVAFNATEDAPTAGWISLRNFWRWLTGITPAPYTFPTKITIGSATVETTFGLAAISYLEPDYIAALDGPCVVAAIVADGELALRSTGQIRMDARLRVPAGYRHLLRKLAGLCPGG